MTTTRSVRARNRWRRALVALIAGVFSGALGGAFDDLRRSAGRRKENEEKQDRLKAKDPQFLPQRQTPVARAAALTAAPMCEATFLSSGSGSTRSGVGSIT